MFWVYLENLVWICACPSGSCEKVVTTKNTVSSWSYEFKDFDLKMLSVSELRILESSLFHSIMVDGEYHCWIISKRYFRHWVLYILKKRHSFLYQRLCWRDSKPSYGYILSLDIPLMAPVIAKAALYCRNSTFLWKELLRARS